MSVKSEGFSAISDAFDEAARALSDEPALTTMMLAAAQPAVARIAQIVGTGSPWQESKLTRADIGAAVNKEGALGSRVAIDIGASPKRAFILRFIEFGTSKMRPYPALRPGWDATKDDLRARIVAGLRELLPSLRGR